MSRVIRGLGSFAVVSLVVSMFVFGFAVPASASPLTQVSPANLELPNPCNGEDVVLNGTDYFTPLPNGSFRDVIVLSGIGSFGNQYTARSAENFLSNGDGAVVHTFSFRIKSTTAPSFTERDTFVHTPSGVEITHESSSCS